MRNSLFKKGLVFGIIVFLLGVAVLPSTGMVINKNTKLEGQQIVDEQEIPLIIGDDINLRLNYQYNLQGLKYSLNADNEPKSNYNPRQLIVKFKEETFISISLSSDNCVLTGITSIDILNEKYKVISAEKLFEEFSIPGLSSIFKFIFADDVNIYRIMKEYGLDPNVEYAEPNYIYRAIMVSDTIKSDLTKMVSSPFNSGEPVLIPDDPLFDQQWALNQSNDCDIDAPEAWTIGTGNSDVVIAVIDTGVDYDHEDLADNIWNNTDEIPGNGIDDDNNGFIDDIRGWDFVKNDNDPMDDNGHGTFCSGVAGAVTNNSIGIAGVSWNCHIMPIKGLNKHGQGHDDDLIKCTLYAVDNDADVISMSWGSYIPSLLIQDVFDYVSSKGVVLVGAAGNDGTDSKYYPASYDNVIAVAATDQNDHRAKEEYGWASNYGHWVDVAAPGVDILSTDRENKYAKASGTSMACPFVSGLSALLLSKHDQCPYPAQMVKSVIRYTTDEIETDEYIGTGRINAYKALMMEPFAFDLEAVPNWEDVKGTIDIKGTIWGEELQYFVLDIGTGENPGSWTELVNSTTPQGGKIFNLDSTLLDEGLYSLKLQAFYTHGTLVENNLINVNNEADGIYDADIYVSNCFDSSTPGWEVTHFDNIQQGIDNAKRGDTVFVHDGIYPEDIKITGKLLNLKSIELIGQNKEWTIIEGCINISHGKKVLVSGFTIRGVGIYSYYYYVVLFYSSYKCTIANCNIVDTFHIVDNNLVNTIRIDFSSKIAIKGNNISGIRDPGWTSPAITVAVSLKSEISDNIISHWGGVTMILGFSNVISNNTYINGSVCNCYIASSNNLLYNNKMINGFTGIVLWMGCFRNVFAANSFINMYEVFDGWESQFGNRFYLNNIIESGFVYDEGYNLWYKPKGFLRGKGNYWYDYTGEDKNGDGIGDTPYNIQPRIAFNRDRFPFMEPIDIESIEEIEGIADLIDGNDYKINFLSELFQSFFFNRFCSMRNISGSLSYSYKNLSILIVYKNIIKEVMNNEK